MNTIEFSDYYDLKIPKPLKEDYSVDELVSFMQDLQSFCIENRFNQKCAQILFSLLFENNENRGCDEVKNVPAKGNDIWSYAQQIAEVIREFQRSDLYNVNTRAGAVCNNPLQQIFYGAPGTGKSNKIKEDTKGEKVIRTTFHPDSDYSTFVGCYKPTMDEVGTKVVPVVVGSGISLKTPEEYKEKRVTYRFVKQAFLKAYLEAWKMYADGGAAGAMVVPVASLMPAGSPKSPYTKTDKVGNYGVFDYTSEHGATLSDEEKDPLLAIDNFDFPFDSIDNFGDLHDQITVVVTDGPTEEQQKKYIKILPFSDRQIRDMADKYIKNRNIYGYLEGIIYRIKDELKKEKLEELLNYRGEGVDIKVGGNTMMLGMYDPMEETVYLFMDNIRAEYDTATSLCTTYIHEMFHAYYDLMWKSSHDSKWENIREIEEPIVECNTLCFLELMDEKMYSDYKDLVNDKKRNSAICYYGFGEHLFKNRSLDWMRLYGDAYGRIDKSLSIVRDYRGKFTYFYPEKEEEETMQLLYGILKSGSRATWRNTTTSKASFGDITVKIDGTEICKNAPMSTAGLEMLKKYIEIRKGASSEEIVDEWNKLSPKRPDLCLLDPETTKTKIKDGWPLIEIDGKQYRFVKEIHADCWEKFCDDVKKIFEKYGHPCEITSVEKQRKGVDDIEQQGLSNYVDLKKVFLVIEEINRGNCAQIFGDLFQLLDRCDNGFSEYPIEADTDLQQEIARAFKEDKDYKLTRAINVEGKVKDYTSTRKGGTLSTDIQDGHILVLPPNLYIWATMNTSDQSLFPIDSAFKRRWEWKYMPIGYKNDKWTIVIGGKEYKWTEFQRKINNQIFDLDNSEDKMLGDYFVNADRTGNVISADTFLNKILFYLWNDVCKDEPEKIFRWKDGKGVESSIKFSDFFAADKDTKIQGLMKFLGVPAIGEEPEKTGEPEEAEEDEKEVTSAEEETL